MPQNKDNFDPALKDSHRKPKKNIKMLAAMKQVVSKSKPKGRRR